MSYFIFNKTTGLFVIETESKELLACYPSTDYNVVCSIHGF